MRSIISPAAAAAAFHRGEVVELRKFCKFEIHNGKPVRAEYGQAFSPPEYFPVRHPFGEPGEVRWCRERWRVRSWQEGCPVGIEYADGTWREEDSGSVDDDTYNDWRERIEIQSSEDCEVAGVPMDGDGVYSLEDRPLPTRWRQAATMPRWASRCNARILTVGVEKPGVWEFVATMQKGGTNGEA